MRHIGSAIGLDETFYPERTMMNGDVGRYDLFFIASGNKKLEEMYFCEVINVAPCLISVLVFQYAR